MAGAYCGIHPLPSLLEAGTGQHDRYSMKEIVHLMLKINAGAYSFGAGNADTSDGVEGDQAGRRQLIRRAW
jgi:hypothetical protein